MLTVETEPERVVSRQQRTASVASPHLSHFGSNNVKDFGGHTNPTSCTFRICEMSKDRVTVLADIGLQYDPKA
jgi:hypothetical protein